MSNPFDINREFESALCGYTSAPFAVTTNSCTSALFLALKWHAIKKIGWSDINIMFDRPVTVVLPKRTYVSVPMQVKHAGLGLAFEDYAWQGAYQLMPFNIWDSARWFTSGLFARLRQPMTTAFVCVSFHSTKTLGLKRMLYGGDLWDIEQGGAILHNDAEADKWFRKARFDGRTEGVPPIEDTFDTLGYHCYMSPATARLGLDLLNVLPLENAPLPNDDYPDLSKAPVFKHRC